MPATMFQELVSSRARAHRNWYSLPISFLVHTTVMAILIVAPLVATDVLPMPRAVLHYIDNDFMPVVPSPPLAAPRRDAAPSSAAGPAGVPVVSPDTIGSESGVIFEPGTIETQLLDGLVGGLGNAQNIVEAPPPPIVEPVAPVRTGGEIRPPSRTKYVAPEYPEIAKKAHVDGIVIIEAIIGIDGRVENARVLRSSPLLDEAALAAVRAWEYRPTLLNGQPTPVIMTVTVRFDLR